MKDHQIADLVNKLTEIAENYADTQQLRSRISSCVLTTIKANDKIFSGDSSRYMWQLINAAASVDDVKDALWTVCEAVQRLEDKLS